MLTCGNDRRVVCDTDSVTSGFAGERGYRSEVPRKPSRLFARALSGTKRLWGFRKDGVFYVLWWDPDHTVYPTELNDT